MQGNEKILVSVIMPIYNAENFLRETLDTVVEQTLKEIEIICVDDGSSDNTMTILQEYAKADERIIIIKQNNQYAGVARNNGLKKATGKYVVFWDADDLFELEALEKMYMQAEEDEADICVCGANQMDNNSKELITREIYLVKAYLPENRPFAKEDMPQDIFRFSTNVPWNKLFRREFLVEKKLQFQDIKQANDTYFVLMSLFFAKRITYVAEKLITYRFDNAESLTGKASDTIMCAYESYKRTRDALFKQKGFSDSEELQRGFANRAFRGLLHSLFSQRNIDAYTQLYQFLVTDGFAEFELTDKSEAYFINEAHYQRLQEILTMQPSEFLLIVLKQTQVSVTKFKSRIAFRNITIKEQKQLIKEQKQLIKDQKQLIKDQKQMIKKQQVVLDSLAVRTALKTKKILTIGGRLRYKK